jgi:hypothetical protein
MLAAAGVLVVANIVDHLFFGDAPSPSARKGRPAPVAKAPAPEPAGKDKTPPAAAAKSAPAAAPVRVVRSERSKSPAELRQRLEHLRSLAHSSREVNEAYAKVALPYAEAMAPLATWFPPGRDPKTVLERAVRQLAADSGVEVEGLVASTPRQVGVGVYQGVATISLRATDSGGMLRFLSEAGRPGGGMVWNGFQLSADAQKKQLALAGELHVLLVEAAE